MQKTLKSSKKMFQCPEGMRKNFIFRNFSGSVATETWAVSCFKKCLLKKQQECSKHLHHIAIEKDILAELNRCIFQISVKYIKLVIPKILFILVLFNFNFYFKIMWPPTPSHQRLFWNVLPPPLPFKLEGGRCMSWLCKKTILRIRQAS